MFKFFSKYSTIIILWGRNAVCAIPRPLSVSSLMRLVTPANCRYNIPYFQYHLIMEDRDVIKALAALAQPHRLKAFRALVVAGREGLTPGVIAGELDVPAATLSFHLKELVHAGLITQERSGRNLIYRAEYACMNGVLAYLTDNCCQGEVCLEEAASRCNC